MHPIITDSKLSADRLPTEEIACTTCPMATWFSTSIDLSAYCSKMYLIVWNSHKKVAITQCSAREEAIGALLEQAALSKTSASAATERPAPTQVSSALIGTASFGLLPPDGTVLAEPPSEATFL